MFPHCSPSSGGVVLVEMLNILEGFNLADIGHNSALYLHLLTESMSLLLPRKNYMASSYSITDGHTNHQTVNNSK